MTRTWQVVVGAIGLVLIGAAGILWLREPPPPVVAPVAAPPVAVATPPAAPAPGASEPVIKHPIEPDPAAQSSAPPDVEAALTELFGRKTVLSMFQLTDFPRRFVATVDNLGRSHAPAALWPVNPVGGKFMVEQRNGEDVVSADNGLRYTPYVLLLETVDLRKVVALYRQFYPSLQRAYADLGFPKGYFNDRLIDVIDLLLATPDLTDAASQVELPKINGPVQPERPWVLYEFADPELRSLPAGQKILLRMGPVNERRIKGKLAELRQLLIAGNPPR